VSLTHSSGSAASIVRFPFIHELTALDDFLWYNSDVSIWSTVEPGIGITASSMATLRPLFVAFLSRSRLLGSSNRGNTNAWEAAPQPRGGRKREVAGVEELGLTSDVGKGGIRVTTTITKTQCEGKPKDMNGNLARQSTDSVCALKGENEWGPKSADDSSEDVGHGNRTTIEGGVIHVPSITENTDRSLYSKVIYD
jgi:hypothetical protein